MESRRALAFAFSIAKRGLSTCAETELETISKAAKRKKKTLFEVAKFLPDWGIGYKFFKTHWDPDVYYKITRINLSKDGCHGKAWGIFHKDDVPATEAPQRIGGANKRVWRYINDIRNKTSEAKQKNAVEV